MKNHTEVIKSHTMEAESWVDFIYTWISSSLALHFLPYALWDYGINRYLKIISYKKSVDQTREIKQNKKIMKPLIGKPMNIKIPLFQMFTLY